MGGCFDGGDIVRPHAAARHHDDAPLCTPDQFRDEATACVGVCLVSGGEQPVAAEFNHFFKSGQRIRTDIESPVESHAHRPGSRNQPSHRVRIDAPVFPERSDDDAGSPGRLADFDIGQPPFHFF